MGKFATFCCVLAAIIVGMTSAASLDTHRRAARDTNRYGVLYRQSLPVTPTIVSYALPAAQVQPSYRYLAAPAPAPRPTYVIARPNMVTNKNVLETNPAYQFDWTVQAGDDATGTSNYGHSESKNGYQTNGKYHVQLPDGRLQIVEYSDDGNTGFVARVTYQGESASAHPPRRY